MVRIVTSFALVLALTSCSGNNKTATNEVQVAANDTQCILSTNTAAAGPINFTIKNTGSKVNEFYLLAKDGLQIIGEVENIGPGISRTLTVTAIAAEYRATCKPGMSGDGISQKFIVTKSNHQPKVIGNEAELIKQASTNYTKYVKLQAETLLAKTQKFRRLYLAGKNAAARKLYPQARTHWERIETVAESFGDLDPQMDAREADLEPGQKWTGWHRIEKDLWPARAKNYQPLSAKLRSDISNKLVQDTKTLNQRISKLDFSIDQIANGSRGLLEEIAIGKITGEEEFWSRTDLWDFQANLDGAKVGYAGVKEILASKDPKLEKELTGLFASLQTLLDKHRTKHGFKYYQQLNTAEVKALSDSVNALSEPLSRLTAALVS